MTDILKRIGDKASEVVNTLKSIPPGENEKKGLEAVQDNVNSATTDTKLSVVPPSESAPQDRVNPLSRYGSRPGEKRIDTREMLRPLGSTVPSYDEGTERVPEDQLAMVHKDEAVLPPDEAEKYRAEHAETKPTTETATAQPSTDTLSLKPYGQVMEEKANQKAAEQTAAQSAEGAPAEGGVQQKVEEKPKLTYGHILAENWLKGIGVSPDALKAQTTAQDSTENQVQPRMKPIVTPPPEQMQAKAGGPLSTSMPTSETKGEQRDLANMERKAKLADYDKQYQDLKDKAAATNDPQYSEQAARVKEAKLAYEASTPWGSESNHPGILGKLGHVAERVAARTPGLAPIVATLPGSEVDRGEEAKGAREDVKEANAQNVAENKENTIKSATQPASPEQIQDYTTRVQNSGLIGPALDVYTKVPPGTTAAELDKRFDEATKLRGMNQKDAETAVADQARKDKVAQSQENFETTRNDKLAKTFYTYSTTDPATGKKTTKVTTGDKLEDLPEDAQLLPVKDMSKLVGEGRAMNAVQDSLNELHKDLHDHPEVFDDGVARGIVQTTTEQMNRASAGLLVAGTGGSVPIPSGFGDTINTYLQNHALDAKTAKAVKDYIADYKAAKDKALVIQMMMQNGTMGRGGQQAFESIINQFPGGSTPDGATALRQMASIQRVLSGLNEKYPDSYADYTKTKPYAKQESAPEGTAAGEAKGKGKAGSEAHQKLLQSITMPGGGHPADVAQGPNGTIVWDGKSDHWINLKDGTPVK